MVKRLAMWGTSRLKSGRFLFWSAVLVFVVFAFYNTRAQFFIWFNNDVSKYLIPPYSTINYFLEYAFYHFWLSRLISLIVGLIFFYLARYYNNKHDNVFFEKEEPYFLLTSIFLVGHPGWILYLGITFIFTLLFAIGHWLLSKKIYRISFYYWWLPLGALAIFLNNFLLYYWPFYSNLVFSK